MDKDCPAPTFCPSDDGKYPGADWNEISQQANPPDKLNCACPKDDVDLHPDYKGICAGCGLPVCR